ncbi:hypothetical protein KEM56_002035, partial [Ascosphaera pollenicola]
VGRPLAERAILEPLPEARHQQIAETLDYARKTVIETSQIFERYMSSIELSPYLIAYENMLESIIVHCTIHGMYPGFNPTMLAEIRSWAPSMPEFVFKDVVSKAHKWLLASAEEVDPSGAIREVYHRNDSNDNIHSTTKVTSDPVQVWWNRADPR